MDIEPPHHPIETKRDFFIHLFTITCGLLIALLFAKRARTSGGKSVKTSKPPRKI